MYVKFYNDLVYLYLKKLNRVVKFLVFVNRKKMDKGFVILVIGNDLKCDV